MNIKISELYEYLDEIIPGSLSCDWDNDGVMVCADKNAPVTRILLTLDVTMESLKYAADNGCSVLISHHPLIFRPIKSLSDASASSKAAVYAISRGITVLSYHTRLDALPVFGVNDTLAGLLEIENTSHLGPEGEDIGRVGYLKTPETFDSFCGKVKSKLGSGTLITVDSGKKVEKVAVLGGDGKDYLMSAIHAGADTFVTGRCGYNLDIDASQYGINVIEAGHYNTEAPVLKSLEKLISGEFPDIEFMYFNSDMTKAV